MWDIMLNIWTGITSIVGAWTVGRWFALVVVLKPIHKRRLRKSRREDAALHANCKVVKRNGRIETIHKHDNYAIGGVTSEPDPTAGMSWASKQILKQYQALPADSQTYVGIEDTLRALDEGYGVRELNAHFVDQQRERDLLRTGAGYWRNVVQTWHSTTPVLEVDPETGLPKGSCGDVHLSCIGAKHYAIHEALKEVKEAIDEKEAAIKMAGLEPELNRVPSLVESLKREAEVHRP